MKENHAAVGLPKGRCDTVEKAQGMGVKMKMSEPVRSSELWVCDWFVI